MLDGVDKFGNTICNLINGIVSFGNAFCNVIKIPSFEKMVSFVQI